MQKADNSSKYIAIIGLGYVGLPLAIEFSKKFKVIGFDINMSRVHQLSRGVDQTNEVNVDELNFVINLSRRSLDKGLRLSSIVDDLKSCNVFIVTVPTPINKFKVPDLTPLLNASEMLGKVLKKGDLVIYESTVYPGCTEEDCVPILEKNSELKYNQDFFCGYSPERINPGDKINTLTKIKKVTSGSTPEIAEEVDMLYKSIIDAGTYKAPSIKVAEASKAVENAQRDLNISFVNELALIFDRMGVDTNDVLDAAATKWNFLKFKPGLVGGHCISVDPYYLAHRAETFGYSPQVILSGRRVNDNMGFFIANKLVKLLILRRYKVTDSRVLMLGVTFKENCPDIRNSKVIDVVRELKNYGIIVDVFDPYADKLEVKKEFQLNLIDKIEFKYDAIVIAVAHEEFFKINIESLKLDSSSIVYDLKGVFPRELVDSRL